VAARSKAWAYGRSLAGIAGSNSVWGHGCLSLASVVSCQVGGLCDGPIPCPEESYRVWCVLSVIEEPWPNGAVELWGGGERKR
jgi:hypothetical protein